MAAPQLTLSCWYSRYLWALQKKKLKKSLLKSLSECTLNFIVEGFAVQGNATAFVRAVSESRQFKLQFPVLLYIESISLLCIFPYIIYMFMMYSLATRSKCSQGLFFFFFLWHVYMPLYLESGSHLKAVDCMQIPTGSIGAISYKIKN